MKESIIFTEHNLTEKVHFVYRVTIDGYYYGGKHSGRLDDLHTGRYKTSSKLVWEKLANGHRFTKIKILKVFATEKEALEFEKKYLLRVKAKTNPKFLNQHNGNGNYTLKQHTEESKEKISENKREFWDENTEEGIKRREDLSKNKIEFYKTELGIKKKENHSKIMKEYFNPNTEEGRKNKENHSKRMKEVFDSNTEEGRRNKEKRSQLSKAQFDPNTEEGRKNLEKQSQSGIARFDINTELGRKRREDMSKKTKERAKERLQNKQNSSILGELMFDEEFIKENFLITDDKNNPRFLLSAYSKLSGFSRSFIDVHKREGKLSFLYGIKSIKLSEEQENTKIKEIEAIIKSRNEKNDI